jgi:hypothetical protein
MARLKSDVRTVVGKLHIHNILCHLLSSKVSTSNLKLRLQKWHDRCVLLKKPPGPGICWSGLAFGTEGYIYLLFSAPALHSYNIFPESQTPKESGDGCMAVPLPRGLKNASIARNDRLCVSKAYYDQHMFCQNPNTL